MPQRTFDFHIESFSSRRRFDRRRGQRKSTILTANENKSFDDTIDTSSNKTLPLHDAAVTNRILRQEISRLKSLLEVSRGKVKDIEHELNHFKGENEHLKNTNGELRVQMKNCVPRKPL